MAYSAEHLRDLLSLAKMLRRFAEQHTCDNNQGLFVSTAVALEARARYLATVNDAGFGLEHEVALHAPVNQLV